MSSVMPSARYSCSFPAKLGERAERRSTSVLALNRRRNSSQQSRRWPLCGKSDETISDTRYRCDPISTSPVGPSTWNHKSVLPAHPSRRPRSLSSGAHSRDPLVTSSSDNGEAVTRERSKLVETQQPHARVTASPLSLEERATRASRSMGSKRLANLT